MDQISIKLWTNTFTNSV